MFLIKTERLHEDQQITQHKHRLPSNAMFGCHNVRLLVTLSEDLTHCPIVGGQIVRNKKGC